ncbi:MAG: hypothetical protein NC453_19055 [Muribaculum sp.]|nr:hypothetical protein [Muribaculum sp.]
MGFFDKLKKSVEETVSEIGARSEDLLKDAKAHVADVSKKVSNASSDIVSTATKNVEEGISYMGDTISEAKNGDYTKLKDMAYATGDFLVETAKDMTGINAYNHYQAAKISREEAEKIARKVEEEVGKVRYLANDRLQYMGDIRMETLKNTVIRFISIVERMNQGVRDKEYEMLTGIDMTEGEIKEMEIVAINHKKMTSTVAIGIGATVAASMGARELALYGVQRLATASTGTAIKNLSGAAAQKATMAWLGGGATSAGGGGVALGAQRLAMIGQAASGIMILTTAATVASIYYSQKHTEATQYLADVKIWEAKTLAACELMKRIVRRSDEIATITTRLETRCVDALDSLEDIVNEFDSLNPKHVKTFQKAALLVKSTSQLCQTPLIDQNGELNAGLEKYLEVIQKGSDIQQSEDDLATKGCNLLNLSSSTFNESKGTKYAQPLDVANETDDTKSIETAESEQDNSNKICINEEATGEITNEYSIVDVGSIATSAEAVSAIAKMGTEIAKTIQICQIEETKRTEIKAKMEVEVTRINAISKLLSDYLAKTFDERSELFDNYFRVLDKAIEAGDTALMSATLGSINSLAAQSPFKNLADFATVQQKLGQSGAEWDI